MKRHQSSTDIAADIAAPPDPLPDRKRMPDPGPPNRFDAGVSGRSPHLRLVGGFDLAGDETRSTSTSRESTSTTSSGAPGARAGDVGVREPEFDRPAEPLSAGHQAALDLFDRYHRRVFAFLRRLTTAERAEDLTQEVFFRVLQVQNLENRDISVSYLFRIGENLVRKAYHREQRVRRSNEELRLRGRVRSSDDPVVEQGCGPVDESSGSDMALVGSDALVRAMELLTRNEQAAVRLIVCRGLSYEQAARSLGVSVSTVNNWKHRGVNKLRKLIADGGTDSTSHESRIADPARRHGRGRGKSRSGPGSDSGGRGPDRGESQPSDQRVQRGFRSARAG